MPQIRAAPDRTVLIATDGPDASEVAGLLERAGYATICTTAASIPEAPETGLLVLMSRDSSSAVLLLRRTLPNVGIPVIVICEESSSISASQCILRGADDYLVAPFDEGELLARVHGALRRYRIHQAAHPATPRVTSKERPFLELRRHDSSIALDGRFIRLTEAQFGIVARLVATTGEWVRSAVLQSDVLKANAAFGASNVRFHVLQIRRALDRWAVCLHSRQRCGYMWNVHPCDTPHCICQRVAPEPPREGSLRSDKMLLA